MTTLVQAARLGRAKWAGWSARVCLRSFSHPTPHQEKALPPRRLVSEDEIAESFLKGTGPGGQKINKTASAVQLKHLPTGIVVKSQETRSRQQNRKLARQLLSEKLDVAEKGSQSRTAIKAERARVKKASASKKTRRKYRKLTEEKEEKEEGKRSGSAGQAPAEIDARPSEVDDR